MKFITYFIFFKKKIPKCHNLWNYSMFQNYAKIFNSIINYEFITLFLMDCDPTMELSRLQSSYFIEFFFWCNYLKIKSIKKLVSFIYSILFKFSTCIWVLYNNVCPTYKILPLWHLEKSIVVYFYPYHIVKIGIWMLSIEHYLK
jgi:hypothetical protein